MLSSAKAMAVLPAEDIERAKRFYTDTLGLKPIDTGIDSHVIFEASGETRVLFYERDKTKAEHTVLEFIVEDIDAVVKGLIEKGVTFEQYDFEGLKTNELGIAQLGEQKSAWLVDPEGNIVSIST